MMKILGKKFDKGSVPITRVGILYGVIFISIIIAGILAIIQGNWDSVGLSVATIILFILPFVVEERLRVYIPTWFSLIISLFLYATLILGQVENYYQKFWLWDVMLHSGSGVAFGLIGLMVILIFFKQGRIAANPIILCLFSFCFALSVGLLWEVFEFSGDELFHTNMQQRQTGVEDTMKDEIMDTLGAIVGSALGYFYLRNDVKTPLDAELNKVIRRNRKKST